MGETVWQDLGKDGLAVRALWPVAGEEDKLLTRQAKFLRDSLKNFRTTSGKAKKGWKKATLLVAEGYPQWKVDALLWMQSAYDKDRLIPLDVHERFKRVGHRDERKQ